MTFKKMANHSLIFTIGCLLSFGSMAQSNPHLQDALAIQKQSKTIIDNYFKSQGGGAAQQEGHLFVLVSFSMPETLIKQYIQEARQFGAIVVLRGMINNDFKLTQETIKEMGGMSLDPNLFEHYAIQQVPALLLIDDPYPCVESSCEGKHFDLMTGAVPIRYALEAFSESGDLKQLAAQYLEKSP